MIILNYLLNKLNYKKKCYIQTFHIEEGLTLIYINFYDGRYTYKD